MDLGTRSVGLFEVTVGDCTSALPCMPPILGLSYGVGPSTLAISLSRDVGTLRPFNTSGPRPLFTISKIALREVARVNNGGRAGLLFAGNSAAFRTVLFNIDTSDFYCGVNSVLSLTITIRAGDFGNGVSIGIIVGSVQLSSLDSSGLFEDLVSCRSFGHGGGFSPGSVAPGQDRVNTICHTIARENIVIKGVVGAFLYSFKCTGARVTLSILYSLGLVGFSKGGCCSGMGARGASLLGYRFCGGLIERYRYFSW